MVNLILKVLLFAFISGASAGFGETVEEVPKKAGTIRYVCDACRVDGGGNPLSICLKLVIIASTSLKISEVRVFPNASGDTVNSCFDSATKGNQSLQLTE